ncbi:hypothetical protein EV1_012668 [Malus domestica]
MMNDGVSFSQVGWGPPSAAMMTTMNGHGCVDVAQFNIQLEYCGLIQIICCLSVSISLRSATESQANQQDPSAPRYHGSAPSLPLRSCGLQVSPSIYVTIIHLA